MQDVHRVMVSSAIRKIRRIIFFMATESSCAEKTVRGCGQNLLISCLSSETLCWRFIENAWTPRHRIKVTKSQILMGHSRKLHSVFWPLEEQHLKVPPQDKKQLLYNVKYFGITSRNISYSYIFRCAGAHFCYLQCVYIPVFCPVT